MTWQPSPQPAPWQPTPYPAGAYGPPGYAPPRRRRPPFVRWIAGAAVFALLLTGSAVVHRTVLSSFIGGASSPEDAVRQVISAIEEGDLSRLGLLIPPDEIAGISDVAAEASRILSEIGDDGDDGSPLEQSRVITAEVDNLELSTDEEQDGLVNVSIENADITLTYDPESIPRQLRDELNNGWDEKHTFDVEVRGDVVSVDGDEETVELDGKAQTPFVMTVEREGSWYVSPIFTQLQYASEDEGFDTSPASPAAGSDSPVEAAENFVNGLAETFETEDITSVADTLAGVEGRALLTYRDMINDAFESEGAPSLVVDEAEFELISVDGSTARVRPTQLSLTYLEHGRSTELNWDGSCLSIDDDYRPRQFCTDDEDTLEPFAPLIDRLLYLVAAKSDGGWKISISRTYFSMIADVLSWVGDNEIPIIRALIHSDPTELTDAVDSVATIDVGDSETIDIEPVGPYVDAGYAIVDIDNPDGDEFYVSCDTRKAGCDVVTVITPSGDTEPPYWAGQDGEEGTYQAVVIAPAGELEVTVERD